MYCGDDVEAVVGDVGTSRAKFGLAGEDTPTLVLPTVVGRKPASTTAGDSATPASAWVVGDVHHAPHVGVVHPIEACAVTDWDALEQVWRHAFERLHVASSEHPAITAAPSSFASDALQHAARHDTEKYLEMMFETFDVPAFYMARDAVLDAFAFGRSCALIAEIGAGATRVVPVYDGFHLQRPAQYSPVGCNQLSAYLEHVVARAQPALDVRPRCCFTRRVNAHGKLETLALPREQTTPPVMPSSYLQWMKSEIFRDMRESVCAVAPSVGATSSGEQRYELPDGTVVALERECWDVGEFLLHPKRFPDSDEATAAAVVAGDVKTEPTTSAAAATSKNAPKGLSTMLYDAVQLCDADLRRDMLSNIILCGGGSLTRGLTERLHSELTAMVPSTFKVRFTSVMKVEREFSVFIGGSVLASLGSFQQLWVSRQEFDEVGAHAICAQRFT